MTVWLDLNANRICDSYHLCHSRSPFVVQRDTVPLEPMMTKLPLKQTSFLTMKRTESLQNSNWSLFSWKTSIYSQPEINSIPIMQLFIVFCNNIVHHIITAILIVFHAIIIIFVILTMRDSPFATLFWIFICSIGVVMLVISYQLNFSHEKRNLNTSYVLFI